MFHALSEMKMLRRLVIGLPLLTFVHVTATVAQQRVLSVDWSDPVIRKYVTDRGRQRTASLTVSDEARLSKLKLPVLAFDTTPRLVRNALVASARPAPRERTIIMDEENPVWYEIVDTFGDITVKVGADLRIHHEFPPTFTFNKEAIGDGTATAGPGMRDGAISVFDKNEERVFEGVIVEYTLMRFPDVPYTVTIECSARLVKQCGDIGTIKNDRNLIEIISARPPD